MALTVKICGLSTLDTLDAALQLGTDMVDFVFFAKSPRHIALEKAAGLSALVRDRAAKVALSVNADDALLEAIIENLHPDLLQFHGSETPERIAEVKARFGLPVMKAIGISDLPDLVRARMYEPVADWLLFDAKASKDARHPGGNGLAFDWSLLHNHGLSKPALVSGGLDPDNVAAALEITGLHGVDVSSGVESAPGVKHIEKIAAFIANARAAYKRLNGSPAGGSMMK
jgi:phosphoribosylanthranilate isomerase